MQVSTGFCTGNQTGNNPNNINTKSGSMTFGSGTKIRACTDLIRLDLALVPGFLWLPVKFLPSGIATTEPGAVRISDSVLHFGFCEYFK